MQLTASSPRRALMLRLVAPLALVLLSTAPSLAQDTPEPAEDVDELIERAGELQSFRATYRLHSSDGRTGTMHWIYRADDAARVRMQADEKSRDMFWIADGVMTAGALDRDGDEYIVGTDVGAQLAAYEPVHDALDQHFPLAGSAPFEPGIQFSLVLDGEADKVDLSVGITDRRASVLGWLPSLRRLEPIPQADDRLLVFERDGLRYEVSAVTGFITRGLIGDGDDRRLAVELVELELDVEIDPEELEVPEWSESDPEIDEGFRAAIRNTLLANNRSTVLRRLQSLHDRAELNWPDEGPDGLDELLYELHAVGTRHSTAAYLAKLDEQLSARAESLLVWADEHRESEGMEARLIELRDQARGELAGALDQIVTAQVDRLRGPTNGELELEEDFVRLEREALRAVLEEELRAAALQRFDETVGSVE